MNNTTQMTLLDLSMFAIEPCDTVRVRWSDGRTDDGVVVLVADEPNSNGRRVCIVESLDGRTMTPFVDAVTLVRKYVRRGPVSVEISDETAARFAAYAAAA